MVFVGCAADSAKRLQAQCVLVRAIKCTYPVRTYAVLPEHFLVLSGRKRMSLHGIHGFSLLGMHGSQGSRLGSAACGVKVWVSTVTEVRLCLCSGGRSGTSELWWQGGGRTSEIETRD